MKKAKNVLTVLAMLSSMTLILISCASTGGGGGAPVVWDFENAEAETDGFYLVNGEFYQYRGPAALSRDDTTFGQGMLKLDVDFTQDKDTEWSELKMAYDFPRSMNIKGKTRFLFDFYYNPSFETAGGNFRAKVWSNNGGFTINDVSEAIEGTEEAANGYKKAAVEILFIPTAGFMPDFRLSLAGWMTDYKGPVFMDNIRWE
jgi:hypothetical protein